MRSFWYTTFALILTVFVLQTALGLTWLQFDRITLLNSILAAHPDGIYLGDSIPDKIAPTDTDERTIPELLAAQTNTSVGDYSFPAYGTSVFENIIGYITQQPVKPQFIILPVNLSTFATIVDDRPEYQFVKDNYYFAANPAWLEAWYRPLAVSRALNVTPITEAAAEQLPIFYGTQSYTTVGAFDALVASTTVATSTLTKEAYVARYMYTMQQTDRKFISLANALDEANAAGIRVYLYITPMDLAGGEPVLGPELAAQVSHNADVVCELAKEKQVPCLNLVFAVPEKGFLPGVANEHLDDIGRNIVANAISSTFFH